jgi:hypothetical protein
MTTSGLISDLQAALGVNVIKKTDQVLQECD